MERLPARQLVRHWALYSQPLQPSTSAGRSSEYIRYLSQGPTPSSGPPKGFLARVMDNIKTEWSQNREIKESFEKFRQESRKLEETEALQQARQKYRKVEAESSEILDSIMSGVEKAKEAKFVKKTISIGDTVSTKAKDAAEQISRQGEFIRESPAFKKMSESVGQELDNVEIFSSLYRPPKTLLKRSERSNFQRVVEPNEDVQSIELHKDSKWSESWKRFKEDNPYVNKVFEFKMKYDESDNPLVRATKNIVDKIGDTVGSLFQTTDLSNVLTEICKVDPNFDINAFLIDCEKFIIPTILEAMCQNRQDILSDWCHEAVFNVLSQPQREASKLGFKIHSKTLDIQNLELAMGKMMDQGPVLVVTFQAQQLTYAVDSKNNIVEGDPNKVVQNTFVMAFCRDQSDFDPNTAWRLIDVAMQQSQLLF